MDLMQGPGGPGEPPSEIEELRRAASKEDTQVLGSLLERHRQRLRRMIQLRMDQRVQGRIDPSDVVQEAYLEAAERIQDYLREPKTSFYLWLRFLAAQKLLQLHRRHLGAQGRDPRREVSLYRGSVPEASSAALAEQLVGKRTSASQAAMRAEMLARLQETLNSMDSMDREVLTLRHFEQLSNNETAEALGIQVGTASKRYVRALARLKEALAGLSDDCRALWR